MKKEPEVSIQMSDDSTNRPATASSRRDVLRMTGAAGAAVTLGALAGQAISSPGLAASRPSPDEESRRNFDVIIIGAGFAGVTAARELGARGKRVLLLEARDRIGGRTWTDTFRGERIERGGAWVDPRQPHIWRELIRYRIPIVAETGPERAILPTLNGFKEYDPVEAYARQAELFTPYFDGAREYFERPYQPLFREDLLRDLDRYSLRDRLDQLNYPPEDEIRLTSTLALYGGSSERGAMTHLAQWWALAGWTYEDFHAVNTYRPADGTIAILQSILADSHAKLVLNSPVASVTQNQSRVQVATRAGRQYEAPEVIMAVPVNVWKTIEFSPPLPDPHSEATTAGIGVPHEKKLWLDLGNPDDRFIAGN